MRTLLGPRPRPPALPSPTRDAGPIRKPDFPTKILDSGFSKPPGLASCPETPCALSRSRRPGRAAPPCGAGRHSPLQTKHWMWKYLLCTRSTSPLHTPPQVVHRMAELGGFSSRLCAAGGSDTVGGGKESC